MTHSFHFHRFGLLAAAGLCLFLPTHAWAGGTDNTSTGTGALPATTTGSNNTADGFDALAHNTTGHENTAAGFDALQANTSGTHGTALGHETLLRNTTGPDNTALGYEAMLANTTGGSNVAAGSRALTSNTTGGANTAYGAGAMEKNTDGFDNVAVGDAALLFNVDGPGNTAVGASALESNTGDYNIAIGDGAGAQLTTGEANIDIGNAGVAAESNTIRIGIEGTQSQTFIAGISGNEELDNNTASLVYVDGTGLLGTGSTSVDEPDDIHTMNRSSEAIYSLRPVSYRSRRHPAGAVRFGLMADEVERVNPALVTHDRAGQPSLVRYEQVNAMLLNEFLKAHAQIESQAAELATLKAALARQQAAIDALQAR